MVMLKYFSENYEGEEMTYINKVGDVVVSLYRLFWVEHDAKRFDSRIVSISFG